MIGVRKGDVFQTPWAIVFYRWFRPPLWCGKLARSPFRLARQWQTPDLVYADLGLVVHILPSYALPCIPISKKESTRNHYIYASLLSVLNPREEMRRQIESLYNVKAFNSYGLSSPAPASGLNAHNKRIHLWEDYYFAGSSTRQLVLFFPTVKKANCPDHPKAGGNAALRYRPLARIIPNPALAAVPTGGSRGSKVAPMIC